MKSITDNAVYIEKVSEQESGNTDWKRATDTTIDYIPREIIVEDDSTSTALKTFNEVQENNNVILVNDDNTYNEVALGEVSSDTGTTVDTHDIFDDGSCIATYQLNGDATDLGGNYDGTWSGTEAYDTGRFGDGAKFNGSDNHISTGNNDFGKTITVSVWIYREDDSEYGTVAGFSNDSVLIGFRAHNDATNIWTYEGGGGYHASSNADVIPLQEWHHIIYTYDDGAVKIYIDKELKVDEDITVPQTGNSDGNCIGASLFQLDDNVHFAGQIDQVRIFNRALTADEVDTLYNEEATKYTATIDQSETPTKAFFNDNLKVSIALEETVNRTFCKDVVLDKTSSTTTEFVGTNEVSGLLKTGDKVLLDDTEVTPTEITVTGSVDTHDIFGDGSAVATYQLNGDATDLGGNYDGTATDVTYEAGKFGDAGVFDKTGASYVDTGIDSLDGDVSISFWMKTTNVDDTLGLVSQYYDDSDRSFEVLCTDDGQPYIYYSVNNSGKKLPTVSTDCRDGNWHHLVVTMKADEQLLYVDNVEDAKGTEANAVESNTQTLAIGNIYSRADSTSMEGQIDQVRIFNKALTADEVDTLYNEGRIKYTITYDELSQAPEICIIPDRSTEVSVKSKTFDGTKFTYTYNSYNKQGRAIQRKLVAEKAGVEVITPFQSQMWKDI